jgi:predicted membrane protein
MAEIPTLSYRIWVVIVGAVLLSRQLGVNYPDWLFTWPVMIIVIGLYVGARHLFCNPGWAILVIIGSAFLCGYISPGIQIHAFIWPVLIILAGIVMIFKPHRKPFNKDWREKRRHLDNTKYEDWREQRFTEESTQNDTVDTVAIFGGVKKNILSKNFKGGEITCVMGGAEINFMQADIQGKVTIEITAVLGGAKLIIPSHWDVQPEMMAILGGIEDKRQLNTNISEEKILVIKGTTVLGGIEIRSF